MNLLEKIKHIPYWLTAKKSGFLEREKDPRDFDVSLLGGGEYTPKSDSLRIKTLSVKNQYPHNTCAWNAVTVQKEVDEGVILNVRSIISYARRNGLLTGDGFSSFNNNQKALKDFGIEEGDEVVDSNWDRYSSKSVNSVEAEKHKIQSYWFLNSLSDIYRYLDEGKTIETGLKWYTGFNQSMGFKSPWIIDRAIGLPIGGHAFLLVGHQKDYQGREVFIMQNSYGKNWGNGGDFYVTVDYFMKNNLGMSVNLDIPKDIGKFLNVYNDLNVQGNNKNIYFIKDGEKHLYPDWETYLAFSGLKNGFVKLNLEEANLLEALPKGKNMDIKNSNAWQYIKDIKSNDDKKNNLLHKLLELVGNGDI